MNALNRTNTINCTSFLHTDHENCIEVERVIFGRKRERETIKSVDLCSADVS